MLSVREAVSYAKVPDKRQAAVDAAQRGEMPLPPDFTAATHKSYRSRLAQLIALAAARDVAGLRDFPINPTSTSPKAMNRYRWLAIAAINTRDKAA